MTEGTVVAIHIQKAGPSPTTGLGNGAQSHLMTLYQKGDSQVLRKMLLDYRNGKRLYNNVHLKSTKLAVFTIIG